MYPHINTWSVAPATSAEYYFASATVGGAGALTLLKNAAGLNGIGYKILFDSAGNSSGQSWTVVGHKVGTLPGVSTTETVTGPNATTGLSANYYDYVTSITASGAMTGAQKIGVSGTTVTLPYCRIVGVHWVGTASAGTIVFNRNSSTGTELLRINTPASATVSGYAYCGRIPTMGSTAQTDFVLVTPTNVTYYTIICE